MKELLRSKKFKVGAISFIVALLVLVVTKRAEDKEEFFAMFKEISSYMNGEVRNDRAQV